jgi:hypothetical protein
LGAYRYLPDEMRSTIEPDGRKNTIFPLSSQSVPAMEIGWPAARRAAQDPRQPPHRRAATGRGRGAGHPPGNAGPTGRLRVHRPKGRTAAGHRLPRSHLAASDPERRAGWSTHPRPSPHGRRPVNRRRRQPQGSRRPRRAYLGELHPGPLRPPVSRVRCRSPRPAGRHLHGRPARPRRRRGGPLSGALTAPAPSQTTGDAAGTRPITVLPPWRCSPVRITRGWPPPLGSGGACC